MSEIKIALLQLFSNGLDQLNNIKKGEYYIRLAHRMKADFVLFPEMWNIGCTALDEHGWDTHYDPNDPKQMGLLDDWLKCAIHEGSSFISHFRDLAKELEIGIGLTYLEQHQNRPKNTLLVIDRFGNDVFKYNKIHTKQDTLEKYCTPGESFTVGKLNTKSGDVQIGGLIGWDLEVPEAARILMLKGAEIVLIPHSSDTLLKRLVHVRAYENRMGMALCNYAGKIVGPSTGYNGIAYDQQNHSQDMKVISATEAEGVYIATFNLEALRDYRKQKDWGRQLRRPQLYQELLKEYND